MSVNVEDLKAERCKWAIPLRGSGIYFVCSCPRETVTACRGFDNCKNFEKRGQNVGEKQKNLRVPDSLGVGHAKK